MNEREMKYWKLRQPGDKDFGPIYLRDTGKESCFNYKFLFKNEVSKTLASTSAEQRIYYYWDKPLKINETEIKSIGTFPQDFIADTKDIGWLVGMSVPPVMTAQVAYQIYLQWLSKL